MLSSIPHGAEWRPISLIALSQNDRANVHDAQADETLWSSMKQGKPFEYGKLIETKAKPKRRRPRTKHRSEHDAF